MTFSECQPVPNQDNVCQLTSFSADDLQRVCPYLGTCEPGQILHVCVLRSLSCCPLVYLMHVNLAGSIGIGEKGQVGIKGPFSGWSLRSFSVRDGRCLWQSCLWGSVCSLLFEASIPDHPSPARHQTNYRALIPPVTSFTLFQAMSWCLNSRMPQKPHLCDRQEVN